MRQPTDVQHCCTGGKVVLGCAWVAGLQAAGRGHSSGGPVVYRVVQLSTCSVCELDTCRPVGATELAPDSFVRFALIQESHFFPVAACRFASLIGPLALGAAGSSAPLLCLLLMSVVNTSFAVVHCSPAGLQA